MPLGGRPWVHPNEGFMHMLRQFQDNPAFSFEGFARTECGAVPPANTSAGAADASGADDSDTIDEPIPILGRVPHLREYPATLRLTAANMATKKPKSQKTLFTCAGPGRAATLALPSGRQVG
jgi:hypothetical protein